ncbi:hypothetical protein VTN77DRAFT_582 [Rasamsonia byssochlamydoides]|uniref:uncharacterized protein n=1 Tax=Rasamsonia byssochlamydoides TaxID=89139 RepID=UPI003742FC95
MAYSAAERRLVYLACRAIFAGSNAQIRKPKKIRELVDKHEQALRPQIRDFKPDKVVDILKGLLEKRIFQSDVKAKSEFPELFVSSPARDAQRAASENDAARSTAETLEEIESLEERENELEDEDENAALPSSRDDAAGTGPQPTPEPAPNMPSLYPSYFPYRAQHAILSTAQHVLEECCFEFTKKWMPSILEEHAWDCPQAVELTKWTKVFAKRAKQFPENAFKLSGPSLNEVLHATNKLRHTAVHRVPTTSRGVETLITSAMKLAEALQDPLRTAQLRELRFEVESKIKAMELNKNVLEDALSQELGVIHRQREELNRREKDSIARVLQEDRENQSLIGVLLEESVKRIFEEGTKHVEGEEVKSDDAEMAAAADNGLDAVEASNPEESAKRIFDEETKHMGGGLDSTEVKSDDKEMNEVAAAGNAVDTVEARNTESTKHIFDEETKHVEGNSDSAEVKSDDKEMNRDAAAGKTVDTVEIPNTARTSWLPQFVTIPFRSMINRYFSHK